jgi:hypothetical protein
MGLFPIQKISAEWQESSPVEEFPSAGTALKAAPGSMVQHLPIISQRYRINIAAELQAVTREIISR